MNIVTCICVDNQKEDDSIYPQLLKRTPKQRRLIYWKCVVVMMATSVRCNPTLKHIVYTNDDQPLRYDRIDLKVFLMDLGIEIRYLSFKTFRPPDGLSAKFKNAFYKLDVIGALRREEEFSILLDSDCVWVKPVEQFFNDINQNKLLVYDCYKRTNTFEKRNGVSQIDLGNIFKQVDPSYPFDAPIHYGGELIGGKGDMFTMLTEDMLRFFGLILKKFGSNPPHLPNGNSIFDYDEYLTSYVLNKIPNQLHEVPGFIKRIQTHLQNNESMPEDLTIPIWHLFAEKKVGFIFLFKKVIDKKSKFWRVSIEDFNSYVGKYMGVPKRSSMEKAKLNLYKGYEAFKFMFIRKFQS